MLWNIKWFGDAVWAIEHNGIVITVYFGVMAVLCIIHTIHSRRFGCNAKYLC